MNQKEKVYQLLSSCKEPVTASELAEQLSMDRSNVSRYLNEYFKDGHVHKTQGRPVRYYISSALIGDEASPDDAFLSLVGADESLKVPIQKAKAAILYPPRGLHTIIFGETGTGKSLFAECMYHFAKASNMLPDDAPFVSFNCADYAQNPQLLFGHIFGVKKGAFTGAENDQKGLVAQADGGILFLDEIHRLPPEGQEMLFTFIDKGVYRPLGESHEVLKATVQIIGATTEDASTFLTTFNRRIPMSIELPSLDKRTLEERYEIVTTFFMEEALRLNRNIQVERDVLLAFMLYHAEANIGQVKRDVKLVCAKSFLHYQKTPEILMVVKQSDLPITVQKGLLSTKKHPKLSHLLDEKWQSLLFDCEQKQVIWNTKGPSSKDIESPMIETKEDFHHYILELTRERESIGVDQQLWQVTNQLYDLASQRLNVDFDKKARFALALHLRTVLDRIKHQETIENDQLNHIRKLYLKEFQLAMELALMIEEEYHVLIPIEEIGYLTLFLTLDSKETHIETDHHPVQIIVMMHGNHMASEMLKTAQQLTNTDLGMAIDMPLEEDVTQSYEHLKQYVLQEKENAQNGVLLLTDMGSLNRFSSMLSEETGIKSETISLVSTLMVMESLRLAMMNRSLEDIYQHLQASLKTLLLSQETKILKKAIIVTCFTGEGVALKVKERLETIIDTKEFEIITMQYIEEQSFKRHIDEYISKYDIRAIVGTVEIEYQNIPYFSALDLFKEDKVSVFQRLLEKPVSIEDMISALEDTLTHIPSVKELLLLLKEEVQSIQQDLALFVEAGVESGLIMHLAFLVDHLLQKEDASQRHFEELDRFKKENKLAYDTVATQLLGLTKRYHIQLSEDEIAYVTQMFVNNRVDSQYLTR